ncbi:YkoP family protein [Oceanobacillus halotolerans]|uniref:YkoP family protein n=1 Tax=Oceanobacillus halotolerans TaxID=2663380 RepID=UPI0013DCC7A5|nr:hypothetical protein [Oceanobacillus halotolerans]
MKSYLLHIWNVIDPIYYTCSRLRYVPDQEKGNTLFRVRLTTYKGCTAILRDGTVIKKGDKLLKIHLHNVRMLHEMQSISSEMKRAVYTYHVVKRALPKLASYLEKHPKHDEIKGIIGITGLYRGAGRLGFEIVPIKNTFYKLYKKGTFMPINFLANTKGPKTPYYLFMSKEQIMKRYIQ